MNAAALLMDILFPMECLSCGTRITKGALCAECRIAITPHRHVFCGTCAAPLPHLRNLCHPYTPYLLGAAGQYADPILRTLIHGLKFERVRSAAETLADILAHYYAQLPIDPKGMCVVPLPLSRTRKRERGFNQSALIAKRFAQFFGMRYDPALLIRTAHRTAQSELTDHHARKMNVKGCYAARIHTPPRKVLLIDDVTTSGATLHEAAHALSVAGVKKIFALTVAKAK